MEEGRRAEEGCVRRLDPSLWSWTWMILGGAAAEKGKARRILLSLRRPPAECTGITAHESGVQVRVRPRA